jgi:hypothetical protein
MSNNFKNKVKLEPAKSKNQSKNDKGEKPKIELKYCMEASQKFLNGINKLLSIGDKVYPEIFWGFNEYTVEDFNKQLKKVLKGAKELEDIVNSTASSEMSSEIAFVE